MDIHDILQVDQAARTQVAQAQKTADEIDRNIPLELEAMRKQKEEELAREVAAFEEEQNKRVEQRTAQIEQQMEGFHARLDSQYQTNKDQWIAQLVKRVTEV